MRTIGSILLILATVPAGMAQGTAQSDSDRIRLLAMESAWNQAVQQKDLKALRMLLAPELVYVDHDGKVMTREQYLADVGLIAKRPQQVASESMVVHVYGVVAIVSGVYRENGVREGKPYSLRERFTDTWLHRYGSWTCVASHSTRIGN